MKKLFLISIFFAAFCAQQSHAQTPTDQGQPIEITADDYLEWQRGVKKFIAQGNAKAVQGDTSISAASLEADYTEGKTGGMQMSTLHATDKVVIKSRENTAYGDKAKYDTLKGYAEMTGNNLKMISPDQTITARERFEYWTTEGRILAVGDAKVVRPKPQGGSDTLQADNIIATLKDDAQGKRTVDTLEAKDNVVITTPTETITGSYGIYRAATNKAELMGNVKIMRGPNVLEGVRAEVDMNTNTSKIFGAPSISGTANKGRVRGVFYPGSKPAK